MSAKIALLIAIAGADPPQPPAALDPVPEEIVVTGIRENAGRKVRPDAVEVLRDHCFEPARLNRSFNVPTPGARWIELDEKERRQFHIEDSDVPAFAMEDGARDQQLWLKFELLKHKGNTEEQRCTMLVLGGRDHKRFVDGMSNLFRGGPTQRHVGQPDGSPAIAGWEQWLWTGMPARGSKSWKRVQPARGSPPTWTVVVDVRGFYDSYDYIMGDMKSRKAPGGAMTMLTFSLTTRPPQQTAAKDRAPAALSMTSAGANLPLRRPPVRPSKSRVRGPTAP